MLTTIKNLENILMSRQETVELIQMNDIRFVVFEGLLGVELPESFHCAKELNEWAKQAYDDYDFKNAADMAQQASKEMHFAQEAINQWV